MSDTNQNDDHELLGRVLYKLLNNDKVDYDDLDKETKDKYKMCAFVFASYIEDSINYSKLGKRMEQIKEMANDKKKI